MRIFHRIDDIEKYSELYKRVLDFFEEHTREFIVATIPHEIDVRYAELISSYNHCDIYQHGYRHINYVPIGWKDEFPDTISIEEKRRMLLKGKEKLEGIFNRKIVGYVPPWNNTSESTVKELKKLKFCVYSAQKNNTFRFIKNKDIDIDIVEKYLPNIVYKNLDTIYNEIKNILINKPNIELGILYHFKNTTEEDLNKIFKFIVDVEKLTYGNGM